MVEKNVKTVRVGEREGVYAPQLFLKKELRMLNTIITMTQQFTETLLKLSNVHLSLRLD